jgi:hypothetical protein
MNNIELIKSGPHSGAEILEFQNEILNSVKNGFEDALFLLVKLKAMSKALDGTIDAIHEHALSEAYKHGQKSFGLYGAKVEIKEMGTKWFFDQTGDPIIYRLERDKKAISEKEKDRQSFLKTLKEKTSFLDEESGEVFTVFPARKESKTGIAITII